MKISEIRVKLVENRSDRLKAFCSITFDDAFVVRDLKIIEGSNSYFVAMPSRKLTDHCPSCGAKNHLRARFCNECGTKLGDSRVGRGSDGRTKLHADVAHPVNSQSREYIQNEIVKAYQQEIERSKQPGYKPVSLGDDYDEEPGGTSTHHHQHQQSQQDHSAQQEDTQQPDEEKDFSEPQKKSFTDGIL